MDESQSLSSVHTRAHLGSSTGCLLGTYLSALQAAPGRALSHSCMLAVRAAPPTAQIHPLLPTKPPAMSFTISTSTHPGTSPFSFLSGPSTANQEKAAKACSQETGGFHG